MDLKRRSNLERFFHEVGLSRLVVSSEHGTYKTVTAFTPAWHVARRARKRARGRDGGRERERERERVCVCVREREREREREQVSA